MIYLDEEQVRALLRLEDLIPAMENALIDFSAGRIRQPVRSILAIPEHGGLWGLMPAVCGDVMGIKLVTVYEGNAKRGLPTHQAVIQLMAADNGEPLVAMDGRLITELRTAAVSAVATRLLAKPAARVLAILGSGVQARAHAHALRLVRPFEEIRVWGRTMKHAERCADEIGGKAMDAESAVRGADVVVTVTYSAEPVLKGAWLSPEFWGMRWARLVRRTANWTTRRCRARWWWIRAPPPFRNRATSSIRARPFMPNWANSSLVRGPFQPAAIE